jgi:uncharacterized membrane protein YeaQ/YmgE (transglycosylase-associated protein family)
MQNSSTAFLTRGSFAKFTAIRRALAAWPGAASIKGKEHESCYFNGNHEAHDRREDAMSILWTIIIGFVAGIIAKLIYPGNKYEPTGYIWTTVLGIIGAFVATYLGQAVGWYQPGESAGFIGAIVGAIIVLFVWGFIAPRFERT